MPRILMILTSHRLDCLRLCIAMLAEGGSLARFDRVVMLCSGVEGRHRRFVEALPRLYPQGRWEFIHGPRGRGAPISALQNECVRRHPDALYFKIDEDTLVSRDWDEELAAAYARHRDDARLSLLTATVVNNQRGAFRLLQAFPELAGEFTRRFNMPIVPDRMGPVWHHPDIAAWLMRRFLNLDAANAELRARAGDPEEAFSYPFSINCIAYDYRHWCEIGGVPEQDENGWGEWIPRNGKVIVLAARALVHHYAFFVQQDWLDRTTLLEDLARANLGRSLSPWPCHVTRLLRVIEQVPRMARRRWSRLSGQPGAAGA